MNRHATLALTALFCGVSLLTADLAVAERELAYRVPEGLTYTFREMQRSNNTLTISGNGQQGEVQQGISTTIAGAATVLAVRDGKPATLRLTFDAASGTEYTINGMPQPDAFALAGQTVEVVVRGDKIVDVRQDGSPLNLDAATLDSIAPFAVFHDALLPAQSVGIGDGWPAEIESQDGSTRTSLVLSVAGFSGAGDTAIATLNTRGSVQHEKDGSRASGDLTGLTEVDVTTGLPRRSTGEGTLTLAGSTAQNGFVMQIDGRGSIVVERIIDVGAPARVSETSSSALSAYTDWTESAPARSSQPQPAAASGDQRLVGMYAGEAIYNGDFGNDDMYTNTQLKWVFNADGTVYFGSQAHFNYNHRDYNLDSRWGASGRSAADVDSGRWSTRGDILTIRWDNGNTATYAYGFEPNGALVFRNARTRKLINFYNRLQ